MVKFEATKIETSYMSTLDQSLCTNTFAPMLDLQKPSEYHITSDLLKDLKNGIVKEKVVKVQKTPKVWKKAVEQNILPEEEKVVIETKKKVVAKERAIKDIDIIKAAEET